MLYNTIGLRLLALVLDYLLMLPLFYVGRGDDNKLDWIGVLILLLEHSYFIIGHAQYGQTLGKRLLGLKVVSTHQHLPIGWKQAIIRQSYWILLSVIYGFFLTDPSNKLASIPGMVMIIADTSLALIHPQNRSVRDFLARTVVIRSKPTEQG